MEHHKRHGNDYGEYYMITIALLNKPGSLENIEEEFRAIGRRFGFFSFTKAFEQRKELSFKDWLKARLDELLELQWVIVEDDIYTLTEKGKGEATVAYNEMSKTRDLFKRLFSPKLVSKVTLFVHFILATIKLPAALISGSVGLLNDALDTLADALSSVVVFIGIKKNKEKAANRILVFLMIITGCYTLFEAVKRVINPDSPSVDTFTFVAALISAFLCGLLWFYQRYTGLKTGMTSLITQSVDSKNHVIAAISVTAGLVAVLLNFIWLDIIVGLVVSILICKSAIELLVDMIKCSEDDGNFTKYRFGVYEKYRIRQYTKFLILLIDEKSYEKDDDLIKAAERLLNTKGNNNLKVFNLDEFANLKDVLVRCIDKLYEDELIEKDRLIILTDKGRKLLSEYGLNGVDIESQHDKKVIRLKTVLNITWRVGEFLIGYFIIKWLSGFVNTQVLWSQYQEYEYVILGMSIPIIKSIHFIVGLTLYVYGRYNLHRISQINHHVLNKKLVTSNYFSKVRHPMNGMILLMDIGILKAVCSRWSFYLSIILLIGFSISVKIQERYLVKEYGDDYVAYREQTKKLMYEGYQILILIFVLLFSFTGLLVNFI